MNFVNYARTPTFVDRGCSERPVQGSLFSLLKMQALRDLKAFNSVKKTLWHRYFSVNFKKDFNKYFLQNIS